MRKLLLLILAPLVLLTACGGGGGSGGTITPPPPPPPANIEPITVKAGPVNNANTAFLSVTVCVPGTSTCQTIDNIQVDSGSSGLRIIAPTVLQIALPIATKSGVPLAECLQFADGSSFGPVAVADVTLPVSGKHVANLTVQIIGDSGYSTVPADCPGPAENSVSQFGANGILGVGPFLQDCGSACSTTAIAGFYYTCPTPSSCVNSMATLAEQVANPVSLFASDNNGVIVELPDAPIGGATTVTGSLVFGIGTQSNNGLGGATVLLSDPTTAFIQATFNGTVYSHAYLDSGSNGNYFTDSIPVCPPGSKAPGFYCPPSTLNLMATLKGTNGTTGIADFTVVNAVDVLTVNPTAAAMPGLAGPNADPQAFDLGLPFFYGRNVYTGFEPPAGSGPYFAY